EFGMPPVRLHTTPVPAQAMHSRNPRRSIPSWLSYLVVCFKLAPSACTTAFGRDLFPWNNDANKTVRCSEDCYEKTFCSKVVISIGAAGCSGEPGSSIWHGQDTASRQATVRKRAGGSGGAGHHPKILPELPFGQNRMALV